MSDGELSIPDRYDCAVVLYEYQDVIKAAYLGLLTGVYTKTGDKRIRTVVGLGGVLNADHTLCADLHRIIDAVLDGRELATVTIDDFKKIAWRSAEWLRTQWLSTPWASAAYDTRTRSVWGVVAHAANLHEIPRSGSNANWRKTDETPSSRRRHRGRARADRGTGAGPRRSRR